MAHPPLKSLIKRNDFRILFWSVNKLPFSDTDVHSFKSTKKPSIVSDVLVEIIFVIGKIYYLLISDLLPHNVATWDIKTLLKTSNI